MRFVDTNILLYAVSTAPEEAVKSRLAREVLDAADLALSVQVLQEFYVQATRGSRTDRLSHDDAVLLIESWRRFPVQATTVELVAATLAAKHRYHLSYWDAAILEAARSSGCDTLLSEDLAHGRSYDGVLVVNPFQVRRA
jgi:predicted nucleic acid-binding protein